MDRDVRNEVYGRVEGRVSDRVEVRVSDRVRVRVGGRVWVRVSWCVWDRAWDRARREVQTKAPPPVIRGALPAGQRREQGARVRLSAEEFETINRARGTITLSRWIREAALKTAQTQEEKKP